MAYLMETVSKSQNYVILKYIKGKEKTILLLLK